MQATSTEKTIRLGRSRPGPRILIAGLGNVLLQDDGVGVHAIRELQKAPPRGVLIVEVGTAILDALHLFEWAEKILAIDAMQAGGPPGTIYTLGGLDVEERGLRASLHDLSLLAALRFLPKQVIPEIAVLGIEPEIIGYGLDLSPKVEAALPLVIHSVREIVNFWQGEPSHSNSAGYPDSLKRIDGTSLESGSASDAG